MVFGISGRSGPITPARSRSHTQDEVDAATPGTLRTWFGTAQDELDAAAARVRDLEKSVDTLQAQVNQADIVLTATERNARRKIRREQGEALVSEDEEDGGVALINALASTVALSAAGQAAASTHRQRKVRSADLVTRDHFSNSTAIPRLIMELWENNLHIPLTALTAASLRRVIRNQDIRFTQCCPRKGERKTVRVLDSAIFV